MSARVKQNRRLGDEVLRSAEFQRVKEDRARLVASRAAALSPAGETGATRRRFVVTSSGEAVRVGNTDPFFHLTEWGSVNNAPYAPLRRGVAAAGLRLVEKNK